MTFPPQGAPFTRKNENYSCQYMGKVQSIFYLFLMTGKKSIVARSVEPFFTYDIEFVLFLAVLENSVLPIG